MTTRIDTYRHLDKDTSLTLELSIDDIAKRVCNLNYGAHRLLSSLVRELRAQHQTQEREFAARYPGHKGEPDSALAAGIEALLNAGHVS